MDLEISSRVATAIEAAALASKGVEICGLLFGSRGRIDAHLPCRNVADNPASAFEIDPAALIAAHRAARFGGPAVLGCYHSHPGGSPAPSARDAADAAPDGALWLIVGADETRLWRAVADGKVEGCFDPVACATAFTAPKGAR